MSSFFQTIFAMLISPPGSLMIQLTLVISLMATFQLILLGKRRNSQIEVRRALLGLSLVLLGQLALFFASALAWQNVINSKVLLPPLDRAITTWCLIWIIWLWSFPRPARLADLASGLLSLIIIIVFLFTLVAWSPSAVSLNFNSSWLSWLWIAVPLFILVNGLLFLLLERPEGWGIGLGFLIINLLGYLAGILWYEPGQDYNAPLRLALLCAYPTLPVLALRVYQAEKIAVRPETESVTEEKRRYTAEPRAVYAWLQLAKEQQPEGLINAVTRAVAQTMLADLCLLVTSPDDQGKIVIQGGYDLVRDEALPQTSLEDTKVPSLASNIQRGRPLRISDSQSTGDLQVLAEAIGLDKPGTLLLIPLVAASRVWGALLLLSPYSNRPWNTGDQSYLMTVTETIAQVLMRAEQQAVHPSTMVELQQLRQKLDTFEKENQRLSSDLERLRNSNQGSGDLQQFLALQNESQQAIQILQEENELLRNELKQAATPQDHTSSDAYQGMESNLEAALKESAQLQNMLAGANMKILTLEMQVKQYENSHLDGQELISSIIQELRQPITSIIGYNEILLSESIGIIGSTQRKFLERIQAATGRLRSMLNELLQLTAGESVAEWDLEPADMNSVIDKVIADTSEQLREKNISLQVDMPAEIPDVYADQDAVEQILVHLLQNAGTVTPMEGTIQLQVQVKEDTPENQPYLLVQVTDSGGGVAPEDLPRIFWRHYRSESTTINGLGESLASISVARSLVEAYGGRIWADSVPGQTTTFSVLLPLHASQPIMPEPSHESSS